jgi:hypothetical protein
MRGHVMAERARPNVGFAVRGQEARAFRCGQRTLHGHGRKRRIGVGVSAIEKGLDRRHTIVYIWRGSVVLHCDRDTAWSCLRRRHVFGASRLTRLHFVSAPKTRLRCYRSSALYLTRISLYDRLGVAGNGSLK